MSYLLVAIGCCLLGQAPGEPGQFEAIPFRSKQTAPPADLGNAPQATDPYAEPTPAVAAPQEPTAADGAREAPRQLEPSEPLKASEAEPPGKMQALEGRPQQKLRPPELIAEALENPKQESLAGTPLSLSQAIARSSDRRQQLRITQAYWRLAMGQAEYHWSQSQRELLHAETEPHAKLAGAQSARAAAEADVRDAQLGVEQAQQELADLLGSGGGASLPLAKDRPHVGDYSTLYEDIFRTQAPPPRIRLIHRTLPLRRKAIDAHAEAIVAAVDAAEAAGKQFRDSGQGLSTLLGAADLLKRQRRAFIDEVRRYNLDIAEYAFAIAPPGAAPDWLVARLIHTIPRVGSPAARPPQEGINPPIRRTQHAEPDKGASTAAAEDRTARYAGEAGADDDPGLYQGLLEVANHPLRVQKLANLLHWDRNLPADTGTPLALGDFLRNVPAQNRSAAIEAYWRTRQCAARLQAVNEQQEQLGALQAIAMTHRNQPGMDEAGVRLHAARQSAKAAALDAQLALLAAQFELTQTSGRPSGDAWLLPTTAPQSGRYHVPQRVRQGAAPGARFAEVLALEYDKLQHRADAVIQCDADRAGLVLEARNDTGGRSAEAEHLTPLDHAIWAIVRQNQQTLSFLSDLTSYNRAIANYALATLPAGISGEELAGQLAIARSTLRDS